MDENLLNVARERPFYIRKDKNPEFYSAIQRDTNFLTKHAMMDYSLLVGIDADTHDLVLVSFKLPLPSSNLSQPRPGPSWFQRFLAWHRDSNRGLLDEGNSIA